LVLDGPLESLLPSLLFLWDDSSLLYHVGALLLLLLDSLLSLLDGNLVGLFPLSFESSLCGLLSLFSDDPELFVLLFHQLGLLVCLF